MTLLWHFKPLSIEPDCGADGFCVLGLARSAVRAISKMFVMDFHKCVEST